RPRFSFFSSSIVKKLTTQKPSQKLNTKPSGPAIHQHLSQFLEVFEEPECRSPRRRRPLVR
ncbi:MAG: hypothetical protein K0M60_07360, partial [Hydrogenophaga sp.]|nr:hypothetical protein [Hydrogenophaga sp.]